MCKFRFSVLLVEIQPQIGEVYRLSPVSTVWMETLRHSLSVCMIMITYLHGHFAQVRHARKDAICACTRALWQPIFPGVICAAAGRLLLASVDKCLVLERVRSQLTKSVNEINWWFLKQHSQKSRTLLSKCLLGLLSCKNLIERH